MILVSGSIGSILFVLSSFVIVVCPIIYAVKKTKNKNKIKMQLLEEQKQLLREIVQNQKNN